MYAHVSFPISSFNTFTYSIPKSLIKNIHLGSCVNAPIKNRLQVGFVVKINQKPNFSGKILKINSINNETLHIPDELWKTITWIAQYYVVPLGQVLKAAIPNSILKKYKPNYVQYAQITQSGLQELNKNHNKKPAKKRLLLALSKFENPIKISSLSNIISSPHSICKNLSIS